MNDRKTPVQRGGRIDPMKNREAPFDDDARIDQAIAESFPASDPPSWNAGIDAPKQGESRRLKPRKPE